MIIPRIIPRIDARSVGQWLQTFDQNDFDQDYVEGVVKPFLLSGMYNGEKPVLPMIDQTLSKEKALPPHLWGLFYDSWQPNLEKGSSVFVQGYQSRGKDNKRKRVYYAALTPDLYKPAYSRKVLRFFSRLLDDKNAGEPLMKQYIENYLDLYWDLHLGVTGEDIPSCARELPASLINVLGYWNPLGDDSKQKFYENYMKVRELRPELASWVI